MRSATEAAANSMQGSTVLSIACYSEDKIYRCPAIGDVKDGTSEAELLRKLGTPSRSQIKDATKSGEYDEIGVEFKLEKETVYDDCMTQGCRKRWLILVFNMSKRWRSCYATCVEKSTFCCTSASARQLYRYCHLHLLSSFTRRAIPSRPPPTTPLSVRTMRTQR
jgi:hypothetical protein